MKRFNYRAKMERHIGRPLRSNEHVHHRNGRHSDNRISNLQIVSPSEHSKIHWEIRQEPICDECATAIWHLWLRSTGKSVSLAVRLGDLNRSHVTRWSNGKPARRFKKRSDVQARHHSIVKAELAALRQKEGGE